MQHAWACCPGWVLCLLAPAQVLQAPDERWMRMCTSRHASLALAVLMPCCVCCGPPLMQATLALLGLEHCRDTIVGDAMIR